MQPTDETVTNATAEPQTPEEAREALDSVFDDDKPRTLDEAIEDIVNSPNFKLDERYQYKQGGKVFQMIAKFQPHRDGRQVVISKCVDHTPNSKYTGEMLRKLRAERGVGKRVKNVT